MSAFIKTRTSNQCRSHHQKMLTYYKDIASIIGSIEVPEECSITFDKMSDTTQEKKMKPVMREIDEVVIE
jgi:hypothetical protein